MESDLLDLLLGSDTNSLDIRIGYPTSKVLSSPVKLLFDFLEARLSSPTIFLPEISLLTLSFSPEARVSSFVYPRKYCPSYSEFLPEISLLALSFSPEARVSFFN